MDDIVVHPLVDGFVAAVCMLAAAERTRPKIRFHVITNKIAAAAKASIIVAMITAFT